MGAETAIISSAIASGFSILTLIISRIKCVYAHDENGCHPRCACMDKPLIESNDEIQVHEMMLNDVPVLIINKK